MLHKKALLGIMTIALILTLLGGQFAPVRAWSHELVSPRDAAIVPANVPIHLQPHSVLSPRDVASGRASGN